MTDSSTNPTGLSQPVIGMLSLYTETMVHPGSGSSLDIIDLPIQRERHTGFPVIPASSLKGSLRQSAAEAWRGNEERTRWLTALFGPETQANEELHAGAISFGEASLVAFPVGSSNQVYIWVTCPLVIDRLARAFHMAGGKLETSLGAPAPGRALVRNGSGLLGEVVLEDLSFQCQARDELGAYAGEIQRRFFPQSHGKMADRFAKLLTVIPDKDYKHLVRTSMPVLARNALDDNKTVRQGPWYEEVLPRDCLFAATLRFEGARAGSRGQGDGSPNSDEKSSDPLDTPGKVRGRFEDLVSRAPFLQVGGNETTGQGWCAIHLVNTASG